MAGHTGRVVLTADEPTLALESRPTARREDLVTLMLGVWTTLGLFLDGYAHGNLIDTETEDFFTPWHALLYAGLVATAAWVGMLHLRRARPGVPWRSWAPPGYELAVPGLAAIALGGAGDLVWHQVYGVETSIDALLSPTHLVLFGGGLAVALSPLRAALRRDLGPDPGWGGLGVVLGSVVLATCSVVFFLVPVWGMNTTWWAERSYVPQTEDGFDDVVAGFGSQLVATLVLVGAVLCIARRWRLPFGSVTLLFGVVNVLSTVAFDRDWAGVVAALAGGVVFDVLVRVLRPAGPWGAEVRRAAPVAVGVLWLVFYLLIGRGDRGLGWPIEVWTGSIVFSAAAAWVLAWLATATREPLSRS